MSGRLATEREARRRIFGMRVQRSIGLSALVLVACTVDIKPSCSAQSNVDVDRRGPDEPTKDDGAGEVPVEPGAESPAEPPLPPPPAKCPGPRHDGQTGCFPHSCSPGQYCDDPTTTCKPGCVTDANCGPRDTCVRAEGALVGRCETCAKLESHDPEPYCVDAGRNGVTECFPGNCEPGQFCVSAGLNHCEPGCVSDDNCYGTEHCVREDGSPVGMCRSCYF